ncbi:GNAT family N-acetyltransferase [bacterium]|nr:GNAT family N-acetyltransferase [bacterium]
MRTLVTSHEVVSELRVQAVHLSGTNHELLETIRELRALTWEGISEAGGLFRDLEDSTDMGTLHWLVWEGEHLVAAARLSVHTALELVPDAEFYEQLSSSKSVGLVGSINRLVVHPQFRNRGLATLLDQERVNTAWNLGCSSIVATTIAGSSRGFQLEKCGFRKIGVAPANATMRKMFGDILADIWIAHRP